MGTNSNRILFDNGGGITLQLGAWAHHYDNPAQCADDVGEWLDSGTTADWDGHDADALATDPTPDDVRNGGYEIVSLDRAVDTRASLAQEIAETRGRAALEMAARLRGDGAGPAWRHVQTLRGAR